MLDFKKYADNYHSHEIKFGPGYAFQMGQESPPDQNMTATADP